MARVLLATFGSLGDLHPYLAVGRALKARGINARIATSSDYQSNVAVAGLEFAPVAPSLAQLGTPAELARRVDIFFAVRADHEVLIFGETETLERIRRFDFAAVVAEHLEHGAAGLDDAVGGKALTQ